MDIDHSPLAFAVRHINASAREPISEAGLLAAISDGAPAMFEHHLRAFFEETDLEALSDLARSGLVGYATLAAAARRILPEAHETRRWLDERA